MEKIAITGLGLVSPSGIDKRKFWANISHGRLAVKRIDRFNASRFRPNQARKKRINTLLKTSSGFSGIHSAMVMRRFEG